MSGADRRACLHAGVTGDLPAVRYGEAALSDVVPSVLSSLGLAGEPNVLALPGARRTVVLLVDGMGWQALRRHPEAAPFLSSLAARTLTAGFPSTTVASLASLGTGLPPGSHGLTGYTSWVEEVGHTVNWLAWQPVGERRGGDLRERLVPESLQPQRTAFERAVDAGVEVTVVSSAQFEGSGLTRAVLRGGRYAGSVTPGDAVAQAAEGSRRGDRSLVYCYTPDLDLVGHVRGPGTDAWLTQLRLVDVFAEQLAGRLPAGATLLVTADHGMVTVGEDARVDYDSSPDLADGVRALAGEPRARHVHTEPGAAASVLAAWRARLGERMWVGRREDAVGAGLFGPAVSEDALRRIGDVVAIATGDVAVVRRSVEPAFSALTGQHGALTADELLVPLLTT
jgi:hypothetical protein